MHLGLYKCVCCKVFLHVSLQFFVDFIVVATVMLSFSLCVSFSQAYCMSLRKWRDDYRKFEFHVSFTFEIFHSLPLCFRFFLSIRIYIVPMRKKKKPRKKDKYHRCWHKTFFFATNTNTNDAEDTYNEFWLRYFDVRVVWMCIIIYMYAYRSWMTESDE